MKEPLTDELLRELLDAPDPRAFAERHRLGKRSLPDYLQQLLEEKGLERAEVVRKAGLNDTFGYQIFMGQRGASRNKVLQLTFALGLTSKEADRLLQAAGRRGRRSERGPRPRRPAPCRPRPRAPSRLLPPRAPRGAGAGRSGGACRAGRAPHGTWCWPCSPCSSSAWPPIWRSRRSRATRATAPPLAARVAAYYGIVALMFLPGFFLASDRRPLARLVPALGRVPLKTQVAVCLALLAIGFVVVAVATGFLPRT